MKEHWLTLTITQKMYGWTKWGGARSGLVKEDLDVWYCQVCGREQIKILPCYMLPLDGEREYVRICTLCKAKSIMKKLSKWEELLRLMP